MRDSTHNLFIRTLTGVIFAALVLGAVVWCEGSYLALLGLIAVGCIWEFVRLGRNPAGRLLGASYILIALCLMAHFPRPFAVAFILVVWANDVFAYLVGITLGRHKMSPTLSPHKTWEGLAGGILGAVGMAVLTGWFFATDGFGLLVGSDFIFRPALSSPDLGRELWLWANFGWLVALGAVAGDLAESSFKRAAGVKDSGRLLPGHGGLLDRFDAMLVAAPVAFLFLILFLR